MQHNLPNVTSRFCCLVTAAILLFSSYVSAQGKVPEEKVNAYNRMAMDGFDVVAYFKQSKAVKGNAQFKVDYKGNSWMFSSAQNAAAFQQSPADFEPQFNGWCAYGVSEGYGAEVDFVNGWSVLEGKLYLNWNAEVRKDFLDELIKRKANAYENWSTVHTGLINGSVDLYTHKDEGANIAHPQKP